MRLLVEIIPPYVYLKIPELFIPDNKILFIDDYNIITYNTSTLTYSVKRIIYVSQDIQYKYQQLHRILYDSDWLNIFLNKMKVQISNKYYGSTDSNYKTFFLCYLEANVIFDKDDKRDLNSSLDVVSKRLQRIVEYIEYILNKHGRFPEHLLHVHFLSKKIASKFLPKKKIPTIVEPEFDNYRFENTNLKFKK